MQTFKMDIKSLVWPGSVSLNDSAGSHVLFLGQGTVQKLFCGLLIQLNNFFFLCSIQLLYFFHNFGISFDFFGI